MSLRPIQSYTLKVETQFYSGLKYTEYYSVQCNVFSKGTNVNLHL